MFPYQLTFCITRSLSLFCQHWFTLDKVSFIKASTKTVYPVKNNFHKKVTLCCRFRFTFQICYTHFPIKLCAGRLGGELGPISQSCLARKFAKHEISSLVKTGLPTEFPCCCISQLLLVFSCCMHTLKITQKFGWEIMFLSRQTFHARQFLCLAVL